MKLCRCPRRVQDTATRDRTRCTQCGQRVAGGSLTDVLTMRQKLRAVAGWALEISRQYPWIHDMARDATRNPFEQTSGGDTSNPTLAQASNGQRLVVCEWTLITCRDVDQAYNALEAADVAVGNALLSAETGPVDHMPYQRLDYVPTGRDDIAEAHQARRRRYARGEGIPT